MQAFLPAILLAFLLLLGKKPFQLQERIRLSRFDQTFLIVIGLGPLLCTALLSLLFGFKLRAGWGEPLFSLGGLLLMASLQPRLTTARLSAFIGLFAALFSLALAGYALALSQGRETSSANFPGAALAATLTEDFRQTYHQPLHYVAGSRWLSGNLAFYSSDHPRVYIQWDKRLSPWINEAELRQEGAVFLWENKDNIPPDLAKRFPRLSPVKTLRMNWLRNKRLAPIEVRVAYLPPASA